MTLPTAGAIEYSYVDGMGGPNNGYQGGNGGGVMIYRRLQERREYVNGGTGSAFSSKTDYTATYPSGETVDTQTVSCNSMQQTASCFSSGIVSRTTHTMVGSPTDALSLIGTSCNAWNEGLEITTQSGYPYFLTTVANTYSNPNSSSCTNNPQLTSKTTTMSDTNQKSGSAYLSYDQYSNVTDQVDYDWGNSVLGAALRETSTTYLATSNPSVYGAAGLNLVHAPVNQSVCTGLQSGACGTNNNQTAQTVWQYDQTAPRMRQAF